MLQWNLQRRCCKDFWEGAAKVVKLQGCKGYSGTLYMFLVILQPLYRSRTAVSNFTTYSISCLAIFLSVLQSITNWANWMFLKSFFFLTALTPFCPKSFFWKDSVESVFMFYRMDICLNSMTEINSLRLLIIHGALVSDCAPWSLGIGSGAGRVDPNGVTLLSHFSQCIPTFISGCCSEFL